MFMLRGLVPGGAWEAMGVNLRAIPCREVPPLAHKAADDAVKRRAFVMEGQLGGFSKPFLPRAERPEVFRCLRARHAGLATKEVWRLTVRNFWS
jgi:hypothetical protein